MPDISSIRTLSVILLGAVLVVTGNGLLQTMLPLRGALEGFSTTLIGLQGTAYFGGFVVGCVLGPRMIRDVGHIRSFAGVVAILSATVLLLPVWVDGMGWVVLRLLNGICLAITFMALESWLNHQASNDNRGRVLSAYIIFSNLGWIAGQLAVNLAELASATLFIISVVAICLSVGPVALTVTDEPKPVPDAKLDLTGLLSLSFIGVSGCFLVGLAEGAMWTLGPVYAQDRALAVSEVSLFMGALVLGGTLSQWPLGRLSDDHDRRLVMLPIVVATIGSGIALAAIADAGVTGFLIMALLHGAMMIPIYPICIAHVNDATPQDRFVHVSGGLLLVYSLGATLGPLIAAPLMDRFGPGSLFLFISMALGLFALLVIYRLLSTRRTRPYAEPYAARPRTTQTLFDEEDG